MCGALMLLTGKWTTKGVHTVEEFDPDPYLDALDKYGLPRSRRSCTACPPPAICWTKPSCAATAKFCWESSSGRAARFY